MVNMQKKYVITEEEFEAIRLAVANTLNFWSYEFIEVNDGHGRATSMSTKTFLENLRGQFIIN